MAATERPRARLAAALPLAVVLALAAAAGGSSAAAPPSVLPLTAGGFHTCAATPGGGVACWGANTDGELGDGKAVAGTPNPRPVAVSGLGGAVRALASGGTHTCAVTGSGAVECWGSNDTGQLGDGTATARATPVGVSGLGSGVVAIAANGGNSATNAYTCALTGAGGVRCFGSNSGGELGEGLQGTAFDRSTPVGVVGLDRGVSAIATGEGHACALTSAGGVECWGNNSFGQLGDGTTTLRLQAVDVSGLASGVRAIAAGRAHTCALTTAGAVKCWGWNDNGQLGDGTTLERHTPVAVAGLGRGVVAIAARFDQTCALTSVGGVECWGYNGEGQLGDGTTTTRHAPVAVSGLGHGVAAIALGYYHTCARLSTGGVECWGSNAWGQLGDGTTTSSSTPVAVVGSGVKPAAPAKALTAYARSLEADLSQLARGRATLRRALAGVGGCSLSAQAAGARLEAVIANRELILARLGAAHAPTAQAARTSSLLAGAVTRSLAADRLYRAWLRSLEGRPRCSTAPNRDSLAAQREDRLATAAKTRFLAAFDPLARRLHLRTWSAGEF